MIEAGLSAAKARLTDRAAWERLACGLAAALAAALPWSTSAVSILAAAWLVAVIPALDPAKLRRVIAVPAGGMPLVLAALAAAGTVWAFGVPTGERLEGLQSFLKLLCIPLMIVLFQQSGRGRWVAYAFFGSCGVLFVLSWLLVLMPDLPWPVRGKGPVGVPVRDYIAQSAEFAVCAALLGWLALQAFHRRRFGIAVALALPIPFLLLNIFIVATSRTGLVIAAVLVLLFVCRQFGGRAKLMLILAAMIAGALAWTLVEPVRDNVTAMVKEIQAYKPSGRSTRAGERLEFWRKGVDFVTEAPVVGHGTGSILDQYRRAAAGKGMKALAAANPHNQILAVAIQLGLVGTAMLLALWLAHAMLFRGGGFAAWAGLVVVTQNVVGSLFNSHLFDFTQSWGYVVGVGVAAGMVLRQADDGEVAGSRVPAI